MTLGPRPALALALPAIAGALLMLARPAGAQEAPKVESLERAQKAADAVFHWIKLNADKGASRQLPAPAPAPAPRKPVAAAPRPAPSAAPAQSAAAIPAAPSPVATAQPEPEPEVDRTPVLLASAAPTAAPTAPMAAAAQAVEPPPKAVEEEAEAPLRLLFKVDPVLPRLMPQNGVRNGTAQVQFTVAPDGTVQHASVIKASHSRLGAAAVDAVRQWRFAPIRKAREAAVEVAFNGDAE